MTPSAEPTTSRWWKFCNDQLNFPSKQNIQRRLDYSPSSSCCPNLLGLLLDVSFTSLSTKIEVQPKQNLQTSYFSMPATIFVLTLLTFVSFLRKSDKSSRKHFRQLKRNKKFTQKLRLELQYFEA